MTGNGFRRTGDDEAEELGERDKDLIDKEGIRDRVLLRSRTGSSWCWFVARSGGERSSDGCEA